MCSISSRLLLRCGLARLFECHPVWGVLEFAGLEARQLPPGADLKRVFVAAMLEWIDAVGSSTAGLSSSSPRTPPTKPSAMVCSLLHLGDVRGCYRRWQQTRGWLPERQL